ncbi:hypothetical protein ACIQOV_07090, partial [Kitasatospora sp. NPDC091257]
MIISIVVVIEMPWWCRAMGAGFVAGAWNTGRADGVGHSGLGRTALGEAAGLGATGLGAAGTGATGSGTGT